MGPDRRGDEGKGAARLERELVPGGRLLITKAESKHINLFYILYIKYQSTSSTWTFHFYKSSETMSIMFPFYS